MKSSALIATRHVVLFVAMISLLWEPVYGQQLHKQLNATKGLVAVWDFAEPAGTPRKASGKRGTYLLLEKAAPVTRVAGGPLSGYAAKFTGKEYLSLDNRLTGKLNISGKRAKVTVIAWVRWDGRGGFVGGMWNENANGGGQRQYGLFVNLPFYNGANAVCGHVSLSGKPTPPFPYSIDYSASPEQVPIGKWSCIAFTYDGKEVRSYFDGVFTPRSPELIKNTTGFPGYPNGVFLSKNPYVFTQGLGNNGSDFTVGAVELKSGMGNFFIGEIGGLAVYSRALQPREITTLSKAGSPAQ